MNTMPTIATSLRRPRGARLETRCRRQRPATRCPGTSRPRRVVLARYYDPTIGRFTATDPLADLSSPGTLDAYGYSSGSPVTLKDPTGLLNELGGGAYGHTVNMCRGYSLSACDRMSLFRRSEPSKPWSGPFGSPLRGAKNAVVGTARVAGGLVADVGGCANNWHCEFQTSRGIRDAAWDSITNPSHVYRPCRQDPGACLGEVAMGWFMGGAARRALGRSGTVVDDAVGTTLRGSGRVPGVLEASPGVRSVAAINNWDGAPTEFVFDPGSGTFAMGRPHSSSGLKGSPHEQLAAAIDADPSTVVGGIVSRGQSGGLVWNDQSGHYWQNWTSEVRQQFVDAMVGYGVRLE